MFRNRTHMFNPCRTENLEDQRQTRQRLRVNVLQMAEILWFLARGKLTWTLETYYAFESRVVNDCLTIIHTAWLHASCVSETKRERERERENRSTIPRIYIYDYILILFSEFRSGADEHHPIILAVCWHTQWNPLLAGKCKRRVFYGTLPFIHNDTGTIFGGWCTQQFKHGRKLTRLQIIALNDYRSSSIKWCMLVRQ